jgi:hypothetical protein
VSLVRWNPPDVERMILRLLDSGKASSIIRGTRTALRQALHDGERDGLLKATRRLR